MVDRFASGPFRFVRVGFVGMAIAAASYWIGMHTGGLPGSQTVTVEIREG